MKSRRCHEPPRLAHRGFTLVEIMVVVTIISLLAMLAVPAIKKVELRSRATATANDLRVFETAFQTYATEKGDFPSASPGPGTLPPEMVDRIKATDFANASPIGGHFSFERNQTYAGVQCRAVITISTTGDSTLTPDADQLEMVDKIIDDGNLNTGNLLFGGSGSLVWIVEQ